MRNLILIFSVLLSTIALSQSQLNSALKSRIYNHTLPTHFDVLIEGNMDRLVAAESVLGIKVKYQAGNIACVNLHTAAIAPLLELKIAKYIEYIEPNKRVLNDTMRVRNRINPVHAGSLPLTSGYDGTGIIMGIIDSGIDFNHPDFKDNFGNTRINFLWDQTVTSPTTIPAPFGYGQEWTAAQINATLCTHSDMPFFGHGTHVSGIAAGNGLATGTHMGVAPKTELVVVALDFNKAGPTIADAVQYIVNKATTAGKPFVINASVGDYYGSHDATDSEAKLIDALISNIPGRSLVAAAGNAGHIKFHTQNNVTPIDTNFTWLNTASGTHYYWLYADTNNIKNVKYSVGVNNTSYTDLGRIGFKSYNYGFTVKTDTLKNNNNRIGIIESAASVNASGVYELFLKITPDSANYFWRIESTGSGKFDAWNFDFVSSGLPSAAQYPKISKYTMPDTVSSMVSSFQCSNEIITVANYVNLNKYYDVNNTLQSTTETTGQLAASSSCGPTRDNKIKPEVAASGASIFSAMALGMQANLITNAPAAVAQGSFHVIGGGTSASSPVVAGLAALFMQAHPTYNNKQIRQAILNCTYTDGFTGSTLPNNKWGYGKLDGFSTFTCALSTGIESHNLISEEVVFPNPFSSITTIKLNEQISGTISIHSVLGTQILREELNSDTYNLKRELLPASGIYIITITSKDLIKNYKVIAQ